MATLLTSDELDISILFNEPLTEVLPFVRAVIIKREPLDLLTGGDSIAHVINLANLTQFQLAETEAEDLDPERRTVVLSLAEVRAEEVADGGDK